jgi:hypothetical protein
MKSTGHNSTSHALVGGSRKLSERIETLELPMAIGIINISAGRQLRVPKVHKRKKPETVSD